jgi:hypothetical protein
VTVADTLLAIAAVAGGVVCAVAALRMTSGIGRLGLLLVLLLVTLVCLGVQPPSWQDIAGYLASEPTVQKGTNYR